MKIRTLKKLVTMFLVNKVYVGVKHFEKKRKLLNSIGYKIGEGTKIVGPIDNTGKLTVGKNCWIGKNFTVHGNGEVVIGDNCDVAPDVMFLTGGHKIGDSNRRAGEGENYSISVGNGVWIGARSTILGNIQIGNGSVVAACSCVIKNIEENKLVGGVPVKVIRALDD